jgi:hypothetical protein
MLIKDFQKEGWKINNRLINARSPEAEITHAAKYFFRAREYSVPLRGMKLRKHTTYPFWA